MCRSEEDSLLEKYRLPGGDSGQTFFGCPGYRLPGRDFVRPLFLLLGSTCRTYEKTSGSKVKIRSFNQFR